MAALERPLIPMELALLMVLKFRQENYKTEKLRPWVDPMITEKWQIQCFSLTPSSQEQQGYCYTYTTSMGLPSDTKRDGDRSGVIGVDGPSRVLQTGDELKSVEFW